MVKVKLICKQCGKEFEVWPSRVRDGRKYCSNECRLESQKRQVTLICEQCGKEFSVKPSRVREGTKYCSYECYSESRKKQVTKVCEWCGKEFSVQLWQARGGRKFCSLECSSESMKRRITKTCEWCGKTFEVTPATADVSIHCSRKCRTAASKKRIQKICLICGKPFETIPSLDATYCSLTCRDKAFTKNHPCRGAKSHFWRGGVDEEYQNAFSKFKSTNKWLDLRKEIIARDQQCKMCGLPYEGGKQFVVHHAQPILDRPDLIFDQDNLMLLCQKCHRGVHDLNVLVEDLLNELEEADEYA